jgi:hypothetical protein
VRIWRSIGFVFLNTAVFCFRAREDARSPFRLPGVAGTTAGRAVIGSRAPQPLGPGRPRISTWPRPGCPSVPEHCRGPVRSAGVPLGSPRYVLHMFLGGFGICFVICFPQWEIDASPKEGTQPGESGESR